MGHIYYTLAFYHTRRVYRKVLPPINRLLHTLQRGTLVSKKEMPASDIRTPLGLCATVLPFRLNHHSVAISVYLSQHTNSQSVSQSPFLYIFFSLSPFFLSNTPFSIPSYHIYIHSHWKDRNVRYMMKLWNKKKTKVQFVHVCMCVCKKIKWSCMCLCVCVSNWFLSGAAKWSQTQGYKHEFPYWRSTPISPRVYLVAMRKCSAPEITIDGRLPWVGLGLVERWYIQAGRQAGWQKASSLAAYSSIQK